MYAPPPPIGPQASGGEGGGDSSKIEDCGITVREGHGGGDRKRGGGDSGR